MQSSHLASARYGHGGPSVCTLDATIGASISKSSGTEGGEHLRRPANRLVCTESTMSQQVDVYIVRGTVENMRS